MEAIKSHPLCKQCQCYPEGRNDCPDHMACRAWLAKESVEEPPKPRGMCSIHGPFGDARCFLCEPHLDDEGVISGPKGGRPMETTLEEQQVKLLKKIAGSLNALNTAATVGVVLLLLVLWRVW